MEPESELKEKETESKYTPEKVAKAQGKLMLKTAKGALIVSARKLMKPYDVYKQVTGVEKQYSANREEGHSVVASAAGAGSGFAAATGVGAVGVALYQGAKIAAQAGKVYPALGLATTAVGAALETETAQKFANYVVSEAVDAVSDFISPSSEKSPSAAQSEASPGQKHIDSAEPISVEPSILAEEDDFMSYQMPQTEADKMQSAANAAGARSLNPQISATKKEDEKLLKERKQIAEAKKLSQEIVSSFAKAKAASRETKESDSRSIDFIFSKEFTSQIERFAENLGYGGLVLGEFSRAAVRLGGHARTWKDIEVRGTGAFKLAAGFAAGGPLGALMAFNGLLDMISGFQDNTAYEEIYFALVEIRNTLIQGFNHISRQLSDGFNTVLNRLHKILSELDRIENILSTSFKEIHIKELVDIIDELKKDLDGEFNLSDEDRRKCLRRLSTWIDRHSTARIQTSILRDSKDISKCLELLGDSSFNMPSMFPFFILQLAKIVPIELLKGIAMDQITLDDLPNISVLASALEVFVLAIHRYQLPDNYAPTLDRAVKRLNNIKNIIRQISEEPEIWDILFRQYDDFRYKVGRAIYKCRDEISLKSDVPFGDQLKGGSNTDHLLQTLDQMEIRRVILERLAEMTEISSETLTKIRKLESKSDILKRKGEFYQNEANQFLNHAANEKYLEFRKCIVNGANINTWDSWGQAMHYIPRERAKNHSATIKLIHELFKSGDELETRNIPYSVYQQRFQLRKYGTRSCYGSWGVYVTPITWMMNCGYFDLGLLYCANGFDIVMSPLQFMNGLTWATKGNWAHYVQYYLVSEMNNEKSYLNKKDLRKAYEYYKAIEAGQSVSSEGINHDCMLWLTCVLGDLKALKSLGELKADVNKAIPTCGFTPAMMSIYCNNRNVFIYLVREKNANAHAKGEFTIEEGAHVLMHMAVQPGNYSFANELDVEGRLPVTSSQRKKIDEGLKALTAAGSSSKESAASEDTALVPTSRSKTLALIDEQLSDITAALDYLNEMQKEESKSKKEGKSEKESPVTFQYSGHVVSASGTKSEITRVFEKSKQNYNLLENLISKIKPENKILKDIKQPMADLKLTLYKLEPYITSKGLTDLDQGLPLFHELIDAFDTVDGLLKSDTDCQYNLSSNMDRLLSSLSEQLKKLEMKNTSKPSKA